MGQNSFSGRRASHATISSCQHRNSWPLGIWLPAHVLQEQQLSVIGRLAPVLLSTTVHGLLLLKVACTMSLALGTYSSSHVYPKFLTIDAVEQSAATTRPTLPALSGLMQFPLGVLPGDAQYHPFVWNPIWYLPKSDGMLILVVWPPPAMSTFA